MRRDAFGPFATLHDGDLAKLLAVVGSGFGLAKLRGTNRSGSIALRKGDVPSLQISVAQIERFGELVRKKRLIGVVNTVNSVARAIWEKGAASWLPGIRLAIDPSGASSDPASQVDVAWLNQLLIEGLPLMGGALVTSPTTASSFMWDWPLQTAVHSDDGGRLASQLKSFKYARFMELVDPSGGALACDLLVVTGSLSDAVRFALSTRFEASLVLVLGDSGGGWHESQAMIQLLRSRLHAGAVACCNVGIADQARWITHFVEELTHNLGIDEALQQVHREVRVSVPLLVGDGRFVALSSLAQTAKRIGQAMADAPAAVQRQAEPIPWNFTLPVDTRTLTSKELGLVLQDNADSMLWNAERGDATALVDLKAAAARVGGTAYRTSRIEAGQLPKPTRSGTDFFAAKAASAAPSDAPQGVRYRTVDSAPSVFAPAGMAFGASGYRPSRLRSPRWVQANIFGGEGNRKTTRVSAGLTYALEVAISPTKSASVVAGQALDERALAPSQAGHSLKIVFTPLWRMEEEMHPAQVQHVHLPPGGDSGKAKFYFRTPQNVESVRARIVVLYENRVLQTLMLAPQGPEFEGEVTLRFQVETMVSADLGDRSLAPIFDASIVINDDSAGVLGLTVIAGEQVKFFEPAGLDVLVKDISMALTKLNLGAGSAGAAIGLGNPELQNLLRTLAFKGCSLHTAIVDHTALQGIAHLRKIQFIEAVPKGYFPIELIYEGQVPDLEAKLCPRAAEALKHEGVHAACEHATSEDYHCPAAFWGFSKCLERHTEVATEQHKFAQPRAGQGVLRPFSSVLLGASEKVLPESIDHPVGIQMIVEKQGMQYARASNWKDWRLRVSASSPSTLLLLPHSERTALTSNEPALEISGHRRLVVGLSKEYVIGPGKPAPLVMVLGCSTGLTGIAFVNSISQFRKAGAAVTLGTVAMITGRQTVEFVDRFLSALRAAANDGLVFDEAFLQVKRSMLAEGNPFVLSLVAYGDSGWRLEL